MVKKQVVTSCMCCQSKTRYLVCSSTLLGVVSLEASRQISSWILSYRSVIQKTDYYYVFVCDNSHEVTPESTPLVANLSGGVIIGDAHAGDSSLSC